MVQYCPNKGLSPDVMQNRDSQQQWRSVNKLHNLLFYESIYAYNRIYIYIYIYIKCTIFLIAFLRKHKRILQTIWQNTVCINSGIHNLPIPSTGSSTCHQQCGKHAWQCPRSLSDVGLYQITGGDSLGATHDKATLYPKSNENRQNTTWTLYSSAR